MVSEDSDLYRAHKEWAIQIPDRNPMRGRYQLLLDLSREVARPIQQEIAKHVQSVAKDSILAKTEVRDDEL